MLLCTVRGCGLPLAQLERKWRCERGHSFDPSRHGYINLLQPQDKRSARPGDTAAAVRGRRRLHESGATAPLLDAIAALADLGTGDALLDVGCGEGFYLGSLAQRSQARGCGVDISVDAVESAARRYPECQWVVANADRFLPYADQSFSRVLSITARLNAAEFRRVLRADGRLLVALAAEDDLIELRGRGRDRVSRTVGDFSGAFQLLRQERVTAHAELSAEAVEDVLHAVYRPLRRGPVTAMRVTLSLDLLLFG